MFLVLCSSTDASALWAYEGMKKLGVRPLELVTAESLAYSRLWEHRIGADGVHVKIGLPDGRAICSSRVRGVLNRLLAPPPELTNFAVAPDREYASGEIAALYLSWLHALPGPTLNRPTPQGMCGRWRHRSEWAWLASRAGLPISKFRMSGHDSVDTGYQSFAPAGAPVTTVLVLRNEVVTGNMPENIAEGCRNLGQLAETDLLGIDFYRSADEEWTFATATPYPDLIQGGDPLLRRLAGIFGERQ